MAGYPAGWALVPIPRGRKGPTRRDWNLRENCVLPPGWAGNVGLAHAFSGTCAIDIDDLPLARAWLAERGADLDALLGAADAVRISSGKPDRAKLLYSIRGTLRSKKIAVDGKTLLEFRCATGAGTTVQDVLPPSIHPDTGKPYEWDLGLCGDIEALPELPADLLAIWVGLLAEPEVERPVVAPVGAELARVREQLGEHDPDCDRDTWVKLMAAVHHETQGSEEGFALALEWSARGKKFVGEEDVRTRWRSFHVDHPNPVTIASLRVSKPASVEDFEVVAASAGAPVIEAPGFERQKDGRIVANTRNVMAALRAAEWSGVTVAFDEFRDEIVLRQGAAWRPLLDEDVTRITEALERRGFKPVSREVMRQCLSLAGHERAFDSAIEWLRGLPAWDGTPRIERFMVDYCGAEDTDYHQAVGLYLWTALAGRVLVPGIKADMAPILVGVQGAGKTRCVEALAPSSECYVEVDFASIGHADMSRRLRGRLVGEIGELRGLHTKDLESIKSFMSRREEDFIEKYKVFATKFPRRLVFVGTTNQQEFLADETGNRRWLPVQVGAVDVARIERDRLQLWAEARVVFEVLGVTWQDAERLAPVVHERHRITDSWEQQIGEWLDGTDEVGVSGAARGAGGFSSSQVMREALNLGSRDMTRGAEMRVAKILKSMGYQVRVARKGNLTGREWVRAA